MTNHKSLNYFQNRKSVKKLEVFKKLINKYFDNISLDDYNNIQEKRIASKTRTQINYLLGPITGIILKSRIPTQMFYAPPPSVGGITGNLDILGNIFQSHKFGFDKMMILDIVEKSIGQYEEDKTKSLLRTFNPFYWINKLFLYLASLPFEIIKNIGLNINEDIAIVGWIKLFLYLIQVVGASLTILQYINLLGG